MCKTINKPCQNFKQFNSFCFTWKLRFSLKTAITRVTDSLIIIDLHTWTNYILACDLIMYASWPNLVVKSWNNFCISIRRKCIQRSSILWLLQIITLKNSKSIFFRKKFPSSLGTKTSLVDQCLMLQVKTV